MVIAAIVINQTGKPAGSALTSRDDLSLGFTITLTNDDNTDVVSWAWEFVSKPPGSYATLITPFAATSTFTPDVRGSYLIKLTVGDGVTTDTDQRIAAIKTVHLGIRIPALEETNDFNFIQGWADAIYNAFLQIDAYSAIALKIDGTNTPTENIDFNNKKITNLHDPTATYDAATKYYVDTAAAAHAIGGTKHTSSNLAAVNALISDQSIVGTLTAASGDVSGSFNSGLTVVGIQGIDVSATTPLDGYVMIYDSGGNEIVWQEAVFDIHDVLISSTDTTAGYLYDKTQSGLNVNITKVGSGIELLNIATKEYIALPEQASNPDVSTSDGYLFTKDAGSITEPFYMDSQGKTTQLTSDGYIATDLGLKNIMLWEQSANPVSYGNNKGFVFTKDVLGYTELFYMDNYGTATKITKDGYLSGASNAAEENLSSSGTETYIALTYTPLASVYSNSGQDIKVYRNGVLLRWSSSPSADPNRWVYNSTLNRVEFAASGASDWYCILYNKF